MTDPYSIGISVLALAVSIVTAWLTFFRMGTIRMTQPTVIYFGLEAPRSRAESLLPKIFLRTLLVSTSKRGRVIEGMHVSLSRNESTQNFSIWVYGDDRLVRGSGLFVGETGVAANHHFLVSTDNSTYRFTEGIYKIDVFARLLGGRSQIRLFSQMLEISREHAALLSNPGAGIYYDWGPDSGRYLPHVEERPLPPDPEKFLEALGIK